VVFRGQRVTGSSDLLAYRRRVTMVFQESLLLNTTVFGNVATGLKLRGIPGTEAAARVMENLNRFGIHHLMDRSARTLSGGEAQRTSLARALAIRPELLLLDEPFGALDPPTREALMEDLQVVLRDTRTTTVLATHDRLEALQLSDRIGVMAAGRIIQIGSPREVMGSPADDLVAAFVSVDRVRRLLQTRLNGEP
jgi:tungstate transport system ATP-binding protein